MNLVIFLDAVSSKRIDGRTLCMCKSVEDAKEIGLTNSVKAKVMLQHLEKFQAHGVPDCMLIPSGNVKKVLFYIFCGKRETKPFLK